MGVMLQRIFDGTLKTNKTKVNVKAVWQKHATELSQYGFWMCCTTDCGYPKCITSTCNRQSEPLYLKTIQLVCKYKNLDVFATKEGYPWIYLFCLFRLLKPF